MSTEKEKKNEINKHKISQIIITVLPFVALAVLFVVFVAVVTMKGYRLDMYLKIVFNEGVVLAVVATGAIFLVQQHYLRQRWELLHITKQKSLF